jgi:hypothetical protein
MYPRELPEPKSFKRKADWARHENEHHRHLEWWTCQIDSCKQTCYRGDNFLQHLVREHKMVESKRTAKTAASIARSYDSISFVLDKCHRKTTSRPQDETCKFCSKTFLSWKILTAPLATHMEHIALPALTLVTRNQIGPNSKIVASID